MNKFNKISSLVAATMLSTGALAQTSDKVVLNCISIGNNAPDTLDDKTGHLLANNNFNCKVNGGPLDKGWVTAQQVYEFKGPTGIGKAGYGVVRHPDGAAVYVNDQMKVDLKMQDGKVVGFAAEGSGKYTMGAGKAKELEGRTYTYTAKPTGPGQWDIEFVMK